MNLFRRKSAQPRAALCRRARLALWIVAGLLLYGIGTQHARADHGFIFTIDDGGVNQIDGGGGAQNDLTQLGIDDSHPGFLWLQWSWDSTDLWAGAGQTGDACAIFDTDTDGNANYSICVAIDNPGGNTSLVTTTTANPFFYACTADNRSDRCGSPSVRTLSCTDMLTAGGNTDTQNNSLITATDPFSGGSNHPNDSTVVLKICTSDLPTGATLLNVCTYPSAGSGGNNNPGDCVFVPTAGFLTILKQTDVATSDSFTFTLNPAAANGDTQFTIQGAGTVVERASMQTANNYVLSEGLPATGWTLDSASCSIGATPTGTFNSTSNSVTGIGIVSGQETICTFNNKAVTPQLSLTKSGSLDMTPVAPPDRADVGDTIHYTLTATNAGNTTLTNVTIADAKLSTLTCTPAQPATLGLGESLVCTGQYPLTQADIDAGKVDNTAKANSAQTPEQSASHTVNIPQTPHLNLIKSGTLDMTVTAPTARANPGDKINYTLTATNDGNTTLTNVTIADAKLGTLTCTPLQPATLTPNAALSCTGSYTLTQADIDAGQVENTATADSTETAQTTADETVTIPQQFTLTLTKEGVLDLSTVNPANRADVGDTIHYTLTVTNTGNTTLHNVEISDPTLGTLTCSQPLALAPGATLTCRGSYVLTQTDIDTGRVDNTATAGSDEAGPVNASETVTVPQAPNLAVVKQGTLDMSVVAPTNRADVGDQIHYTLLTTNTGNTTLTNVTMSDPKLPSLTCAPLQPATLAVGAALQCTGSYVLTQADIDGGQVDNTATADSAETQPKEEPHSVAVPQTPQLILSKSGRLDMTVVAPTDRADVGDQIDYTLITTNTGNTTLTNVTITDPKVGALSCSPSAPATLAPGQTLTCTGSYSLTQADINAGKVENTASADSDQTNPVTTPKTIPVPRAPRLALTKSGAVDRTVVAPTNRADVGDKIHYTLTATNTGNVSLTNVNISDPKLGALSCTPTAPATLAPGASITCSGSHTITQADIDAGTFDNTATASGVTPINQPVNSGPQTVHKPLGQVVHLTLTKETPTLNYDVINDVIHYTLVATNQGNTTLTSVSVSDPKLGTLTCMPTQPTTLLPGETLTCTGSYTIVQNDIDAGKLDNTATASGTGPQGQPASAEASQSIPAALAPHLSLTKNVAESSYDAVHQVLHYTLVARNDGNGTLTNVSISDPMLGTLACTPAQPATLSPNDSLTCTGEYAVTQADLDAGHVANTANAAGRDPQSQAVTALPARARVPASQQPELTLSKNAQESSFNAVSNILHYVLVAANRGNVTLTSVQIRDPHVTITGCTPAQPVTLAPGETLTCSGEYVVTQTDLDAGSFTNTADAQGDDPNDQSIIGGPSTATVPAALAPLLTLTKTVQEISYSSPGEVLHYTLVASNDGNVQLHNVTIEDAKLGSLVCTPAQPVSLAPGQILTCTGSYTVTQADVDAGQVDNSATATSHTPQDEPVNTPPATARIPAGQAPHLTFLKQVQESTYSTVGDVLHYTLTAVNDGNVTLFNVSISDPLLSGLTCTPNQPLTLAPGESLICMGTYTVTQADLDTGSFQNVAVVSGTDPQDEPVTSIPSGITVPASTVPSLSLQKSVEETNYNQVGDVLHYTLTALNNGNVTLSNVSISDPQLSSLTCVPAQPATLAPGESLVCTGTYTVTQVDLDAGVFQNTAMAEGLAPDGDPVDPPHSTVSIDAITPDLNVQKSAFLAEDLVEPAGLSRGDILGYVISIRNLGDGPAPDVLFSDTPDAHTTLVAGSVMASKGTIIRGNTVGDEDVLVELGTLESGELVTITFNVQINPDMPSDVMTVRNQGVVQISNPDDAPTGADVTPSDDPAVEGPADPTITPVLAAPTALPPGEEPELGRFNYLPLVQTQ